MKTIKTLKTLKTFPLFQILRNGRGVMENPETISWKSDSKGWTRYRLEKRW